MGEIIAIGSKTDRLYAVVSLKRKARSVRLEAARAAPSLAEQLKSLAVMLEAQAEQIENSIAA